MLGREKPSVINKPCIDQELLVHIILSLMWQDISEEIHVVLQLHSLPKKEVKKKKKTGFVQFVFLCACWGMLASRQVQRLLWHQQCLSPNGGLCSLSVLCPATCVTPHVLLDKINNNIFSDFKRWRNCEIASSDSFCLILQKFPSKTSSFMSSM